ncbi:MTAP family purine nucleoside phosphorylase, partial [Candidatus Woesearchaeota archaeon]|nr:MTAP family purine nucleoside phosphorylase [Candidatus Woesearchaeota archaeon]
MVKTKLGVIGGSVFFSKELFDDAEEKEVNTEHGKAVVLVNENIVFVPRHGVNKNIPPHKINHKANILALKDSGVKDIIAVNSCGSLKEDIAPGSIVIPDDFICFWQIPTFFEKEIKHITPEIDEALREKIISESKEAGMQVLEKGIYVQTIGPRIETKAEIYMLKNYADIVGMTMASEATLAKEMGLNYASICSIDNYANGIKGKVTNELIAEEREKNTEKIKKLLTAV